MEGIQSAQLGNGHEPSNGLYFIRVLPSVPCCKVATLAPPSSCFVTSVEHQQLGGPGARAVHHARAC